MALKRVLRTILSSGLGSSEHITVVATNQILSIYTAISSFCMTGCGGNIKNDRGVVMSPLFPRQYSPNLNCQWFITVSAGRTIKLKFRNFDIHKTTGCSADYVEIREYGKYFQRSLGRYCGTGTPGRLTTAIDGGDNRYK